MAVLNMEKKNAIRGGYDESERSGCNYSGLPAG